MGYATKSGYGIDLRYTKLSPEFKENKSSIMQDISAYTLGLTKYFKGNDLKIQTAFSQYDIQGKKDFKADLIVQIVF